MAIVLNKEGLKRGLAEKIASDLVLRSENAYTRTINMRKFFDNRGDSVAVPYYYGLKLLLDLAKPEDKVKVWQEINPIVEKRAYKFLGTIYEAQQPLIEQAKQLLAKNRCVLFEVETGIGKTIMTIYLTSLLECVSMMITENLNIATQWKNAIEKISTAKVWVVPLAGNGTPPPDTNFIICMTGRYQYIPESLRTRIGCLVLDEIHKLCTNEAIPAILSCTPRYIIGCSATMYRSDKMDKMIELLAGPERVIKKSSKPFTVYKIKTGIVIPVELNKQGKPDWLKYLKALATNDERNRIIATLIKNNQDKKTLIMGSLDELHVQPMFQRLLAMGLSIDSMSGSKTSYNDSQNLIGTYSKIGTGFDEANMCPTFNGRRFKRLYMLNSIKDTGPLDQAKGRIFRVDEFNDFPDIFIFVDENPISKKHAKLNCDYFTSINGTVHEIDLTTLSQK